MSITSKDILLLAHAGLGMLGCLAALWVFVEALNARQENEGRIRIAALVGAVAMVAAWIAGGYLYVHFYPADKTLILKGPWPFAHNIFMETKEHLFFATGVLSFYLVIATRDRLHANGAARRMVMTVSLLILLTGIAVEGAGAIINHGVEVALASAHGGPSR